MHMTSNNIIYALDLLGIASFAFSGALRAIRRRPDLVGITILAGATAIGFNFYPKSPRYIAPESAARIATVGAIRVGVFVNEPAPRIAVIARIAALDAAQAEARGELVDEDALLVGQRGHHAGSFHLDWLVDEHNQNDRDHHRKHQVAHPGKRVPEARVRGLPHLVRFGRRAKGRIWVMVLLHPCF